MSSNFNNNAERNKTGTLSIVVPHWLTQIRIYDNAYQLIQLINEFNQSSETLNIYEADIQLNAGIYELEATFANRAERKLVKIIAGGKSYFELSKDMQDFIAQDATQASKPMPQTAPKSSGTIVPVDSCLCMQVRITNDFVTNPSFYINLFDVLSLGNSGKPFNELGPVSVINFSEDLDIFPEEREVHFYKELFAGYYILEWQSEDGVQCHQPIYLHKGYTTKVFLSLNKPIFSSFYMALEERWTSRPSNNDEEMVAQTILAALSQETRHSIILKDKIKPLLLQEHQNPWLGVLAAYALVPDISVPLTEEEEKETRSLFSEIMTFLQQRLPDHPDVHALTLKKDIPDSQPFYFPPLLVKGLRRVSKHAELFDTTVPEKSLTDLLSRTALMNTPWTNWLVLQDEIVLDRQEISRSIFAAPAGDTEKAFDERYLEFKGGISPKIPSFKFENTDANTVTSQCTFSTLQEVSLLNTMCMITKNNFYHNMPNIMTTSSIRSLFNVLTTKNTSRIVNATNLGKSQVYAGIQSVFDKTSQFISNNQLKMPLSTNEQLIIKYALQEISKNTDPELIPENQKRLISLADPVVRSSKYRENPDSNIEECIAILEAEISRILLLEKDKTLPGSKQIVQLLRTIVHEILGRADFILTTNASGEMLYSNGAFIHLISFNKSSIFEELESGNRYENRKQHRKDNLTRWQDSLKALPLGESIIGAPSDNLLFEKFEVKRSELNNDIHPAIDGFINVIRGNAAKTINATQLEKIVDLLSILEIYVPLYTLYSPKDDDKYRLIIEKNIEELTNILR